MLLRFMLLTMLLFPLQVNAQDATRRAVQQMHRLHSNPESYIGVLEDPSRDAYQKPHEVLSALGLQPGEVIADIGAGSGYFTFRMAHHVGDNGRVYAVDVSPDMILHINRRIRELKVKNVISILADPDDPLLSDATVNRFFFCDSWHHIENQKKYLTLMKRMLKPGGQVVMIDFQKKDMPFGPPLEMKIDREDVIHQMESNGFHLIKEHKILPYQYFLVFAVK